MQNKEGVVNNGQHWKGTAAALSPRLNLFFHDDCADLLVDL